MLKTIEDMNTLAESVFLLHAFAGTYKNHPGDKLDTTIAEDAMASIQEYAYNARIALTKNELDFDVPTYTKSLVKILRASIQQLIPLMIMNECRTVAVGGILNDIAFDEVSAITQDKAEAEDWAGKYHADNIDCYLHEEEFEGGLYYCVKHKPMNYVLKPYGQEDTDLSAYFAESVLASHTKGE